MLRCRLQDVFFTGYHGQYRLVFSGKVPFAIRSPCPIPNRALRRIDVKNGKREMNENTKLASPEIAAGNVLIRTMASPLFNPLLLAAILCYEFVVLLALAHGKHLWYDELLTLDVSSLHPFSHLLQALMAGVDGMSPGYYLMVGLARMLPGSPEVTLRLPSICGYIMTLLGVYWFAQKKLPAPAALIAVLLVTMTPFRTFALEARAYALLVGFLAIAAALWQRLDEKRFLTPLLAVFLTLAVSCHHLAIVSLSAFGMAELTYTLLSKRVRWGVWASCVVATVPFFVSLPILLHFKATFGKNFWSKPDSNSILHSYSYYTGLDIEFTVVLMVLFALLIWAAARRILRKFGDRAPLHSFSLPELALVGGILFYPALLVILTMLLHSGYTERYGWPAIFGLALVALCFLGPALPASGYLLAALGMGFLYQGAHDYKSLRATDLRLEKEHWKQLDAICRDEPDLPVVIGGGHMYLAAVQYAPSDLRNRLLGVVDPDLAIHYLGWDSIDRANLYLASFVPLKIDTLAAFEASPQRFLLSAGGKGDWLTQYLLEKKYHLTVVSDNAVNPLYIVER